MSVGCLGICRTASETNPSTFSTRISASAYWLMPTFLLCLALRNAGRTKWGYPPYPLLTSSSAIGMILPLD